MEAVICGSIPMVEYLLSRGANMDFEQFNQVIFIVLFL